MLPALVSLGIDISKTTFHAAVLKDNNRATQKQFCRDLKPALWQPAESAIAELQAFTRRLEALEQMVTQEKNRLSITPAFLREVLWFPSQGILQRRKFTAERSLRSQHHFRTISSRHS